MPARLVRIDELQPTDTPRPNSFGVLRDFPIRQLDEIDEKEGLPQAWQTEAGLLISDGNQRTAARAAKGLTTVRVDYQGHVPEYMQDFLDIITESAKRLQNECIYNFKDLIST